MITAATMTCPDCAAPRSTETCTNEMCPGTAKARWDAAVIAERQLIDDIRADDGASEERGLALAVRLRELEHAFSAAEKSAASRAWIRTEFMRRRDMLRAAERNWERRAQRRVAAAERIRREAEEIAARSRLDEIRSRYRQDRRLTLDEFRFLLNHEQVEIFDSGPDGICAGIAQLLTSTDEL